MTVDGGTALVQQRKQLQVALAHSGQSLEQLWLLYFELGGAADLLEVEAFLSGLLPLPALQRDLLAAAVNEHLDELHRAQRASYSSEGRRRRPSRPLPALVDLLRASHHAPPDRLASLSAVAGRQLGLEVVLYLVDHDQSRLVPVPGPESAQRDAVTIDGTVAGQAFQRAETTGSSADGAPRLWVPVLDGLERLGVLDVQLDDVLDAADPDLREQCEALATLLGHLVLTSGARGDALDAVRRRMPRTAAAELIWQLLPPPTGGTETFTVSGWVMPTETVGGDAFDYALSERAVSVAVFDAMGHGQVAGLAAATAVSAYRSARRNGNDLPAQARAVDDAVAQAFPDGTFVTGVLAEIDLSSGALRYLCAGHPAPMVLRAGKVVRRLERALRAPFGVSDELPIAEERLEPGDWLVLHTDGITEARDQHGELFGERRLQDLLEREAAGVQPPAETVRRISRAVLAHQGGDLRDDATIVLAAWVPTSA